MVNNTVGKPERKDAGKSVIKLFTKSAVLLIVLLILFFTTSFAVDYNFFGIQIYDFNSAVNAIYNVKSNGSGGVTYDFDTNLGNNSIYCFSRVDNNKITFNITNKSSSTVELLYFTDYFELLTYSNQVYKMEPSEIMEYPDKLHPGKTLSVSFSNPVSSVSEVKYLAANIGQGKLMMFMKRIE
ncbi:hypothetical protein [Halanaerobium sp. MA284_MarDTE_T2]|uniref:hypothetical protein n=1 Tax=Halanaerobium sp. MA284_MarDTE_T2 TaxID=2183913 RepID=UPI000DF18DF8|nr:hypothetical protein [Halanaerobium sp. MA284_MarDTE_T2]RCW41849.1 hypothetical protein DFR78_1282 [Halanaerobium sp. MA284_MarDTE_T2]